MAPLIPLYAAGAALRLLGQSEKRLGWPVVSVGNLSVGGSGKTPFVVALAGLLVRAGMHVDVLSGVWAAEHSRGAGEPCRERGKVWR